MRWVRVLCSSLGVVALTAVGACSSDGDPDPAQASGTGSGAGAGASGCQTSADCDDANVCTFDTCAGSYCQHEARFGPEPSVPDPDPDDCMVPTCSFDGLGEGPDTGAACTQASGAPGLCGNEGTCGCAAPLAVAARWVDPVNGVDDGFHGGAPGSCAYKTLTFALTQAQLDIHVAPGTYDAAAGEVFPLVLDDTQRILCEEVGGQRPLISGGGTHTTYTATIIAGGSGNVVSGCDIAGVDEPAYCIDSTGNTTDEIRFEGNDLTGCLNGIRLATGGAIIQGNTIHDNGLSGIHAQFGENSAIVDNVFSGNPTDIHCNAGMGWPTMVGSGNQGDDGPPSCVACDGCPFQ